MPRARASDRRRRRRAPSSRVIAAVSLGAAACLGPAGLVAPAAAMPPADPSANPRATLPLPVPLRPDALPVPGTTADRLRRSRAPGPVDIHDDIDVALAPDGTPVTVVDRQRLVVTGTGDYAVYERGPARQALAAGDAPPPVAKLGTVVWEGFSPGRRELAAALTLDPQLEAARLPVAVHIAARDSSGRPLSPADGGQEGSARTIEVTVADQSAAPALLPTGAAAAAALARVGGALEAAADRPGRRPPTAGRELPGGLPADPPLGQRSADVAAAEHVSGTITAPCATGPLHGPGVTPAAGGGVVAGTLVGGSVSWRLPVAGGCRLGLALDVRPGIDRRSCAPPAGSRSWAGWAARRPDARARAAATDELVAAAASAARAAGYYPYLQPDVAGTASGVVHLALAPVAAASRAPVTRRVRPGAVALAVLAALLVVGNAAALHRRL